MRLFPLLLLACATTKSLTAPSTATADKLNTLLIGTFDSAAQAAANSEDYKPIQLAICQISAPTLGPRVLYVEQAMQTMLDKPYRQRLYVIEPGTDASTAVSRVLELKAPPSAVGLCAKAERPVFTAADAEEKVGCAVTLTWNGRDFVGSTQGSQCPSSLRGARYATSEVTLNEAGLTSWDRGYDEKGVQVWGAEKGPYLFVRQSRP
jgi:CpeT/CpcT family (DUF1001)